MLVFILICIAAVALDLLTKHLAVLFIKPLGKIVLIDGVFNLTYVENRGAAFGILSEHRWVFMALSVVAIAVIFIFMYLTRSRSTVLSLSLSLIAAGGIGNMIDRVRFGYVVDFIDVELVWSYVFNIADCAVCVGCGLLIVWLIVSEIRDSKRAGQTPSQGTACDAAEAPESVEAAEAAVNCDSAEDAALREGESK